MEDDPGFCGVNCSCDYLVQYPDHQPLHLVPHHVGCSSHPVVTSSSNPVVGSSSNHIVGSSSNPVVGSSSNHIVDSSSNPVVGSSSNHVVGSSSNPVVDSSSSGIDVNGRRVGRKGSSKPKASKKKNGYHHVQGMSEKYPFVTRENIASHLQKHKTNLIKMKDKENSAKASSKSVPLKIPKESNSQSIHPKTSNSNSTIPNSQLILQSHPNPTNPISSQVLVQSHPNSTNPISSQVLLQSHPNSTNPISSQVLLQSHPNSTNPISSQVLLQSHPNSTNPISSQVLLQSHPNSTNPISSQVLLQSHPNSTNPIFSQVLQSHPNSTNPSFGGKTWFQNSQGCGFKQTRKQFEHDQFEHDQFGLEQFGLEEFELELFELQKFYDSLKRSRNHQVHYQQQQHSFNNNACLSQESPNWALPIGQSSMAPTNDLAVSTSLCPPPISANQISGNDSNVIGFHPIMDFNSFGGWNNTNNDPSLGTDLPNFGFGDYNYENSEPLGFGYPLNLNTINGFQVRGLMWVARLCNLGVDECVINLLV
ncbi:probable serine/threonine-protein kinase cdc7 [Cucumis sativus]|uniref:probable serine/threonine-protein kinase cdc7 n=1 Tax=Cucumis sativus TaxID=3659 RepID=UPI0012F4F541|nr:probable serine/threonine-protein kinase cdc7 [Cucumis sativus]